MKFLPLEIDGVFEIRLDRITDDRGFFARAWCTDEFREAGLDIDWVQMNLARSHRAGTLRGLHYQADPWGEAKLVRCVRGSVFDVAVDLREGSATLNKWVGAELTAEEGNMLLVPPGCAHGYLTLVDETDLLYQSSHRYVPEAAGGARYDDPVLAIGWPGEIVVVSDRDRSWPLRETNPERKDDSADS